MKEKLFFFSIKHPLVYILSLAMLLKLLAAIVTQGMVIDNVYFNYFNVPTSWLAKPWLVFIIRLLLGAFSLLIITFGYRIVKIISDKTTALETATLLAFLSLMPYITVHPMPSVMAIPFLLYGTLLIVKQHYLIYDNETEKFHRTTFIVAGFSLGLSFALWHHNLFYFLGILIALFILKNKKGALMSLIGFIFAICITETIPDLIIYGKPFMRTLKFLNDSWEFIFSKDILWRYGGLLIPISTFLVTFVPLSIMVLIGFNRVWKKYLLLFLPTLVYVLFPNQEWISLYSVIPTFIICGFVGWKEFKHNSPYWANNKRMLLILNISSIVVNTAFIVLIFIMNI